jgi:redox-sensitive bicupin YhaK (pirin superfamily)
MLVHHRHSFWNWDLIRYFQRQFILPEGFPAHPHRGFTTLTYFLKGGFQHRDSLGICQHYGADLPHHSQWLFTGAGLLHEEMFDDSPNQELYQLWVNVPASQKLLPPQVDLLGEDECPRIIDDGSSTTIVLAGSYQGQTSQTPIRSDMNIFHVQIQPNQTWKCSSALETVVLYIRQGSCSIDGQEIPVHHTAYLETIGSNSVELVAGKEGVDTLVLMGQPLHGEPVAAQGSMVMNYPEEINKAYGDYQVGLMGRPWDHKLTDDEWKAHVQQYPCRYPYVKGDTTTR